MKTRPDLRGLLKSDRADAPGQGRMSETLSAQPVPASKTEAISQTPFAAVSSFHRPSDR